MNRTLHGCRSIDLARVLSVTFPPQRQIHIVKINTKRIILIISEWSAEQTINSIKNGITKDSQVIDMTK